MNKNIFLDTNIVLDILDTTRPSGFLVDKLFKKIFTEDRNIFISEDMITTIFYLDPNKSKTLEFFKTIQNDWNIVGFSSDVIKDAINISLAKNLDLEDVLQCLCAKKNSCDILITNDKKFYDCGVKILTTKEYLDEK